MTKLDPAGLEAAYARAYKMSTSTHICNKSALAEAITAYLSTTEPSAPVAVKEDPDYFVENGTLLDIGAGDALAVIEDMPATPQEAWAAGWNAARVRAALAIPAERPAGGGGVDAKTLVTNAFQASRANVFLETPVGADLYEKLVTAVSALSHPSPALPAAGEVERVARAIAAELGNQDQGEPFVLDALLTLPWLDQGEVDFGKVAVAALAALRNDGGE